MLFRTRLAELLKAKNFKQADLFKVTKIPRSLISNYLSGKATPTLENAKLLAQAFDVSLDELVGWQPKVYAANDAVETEQERELLRMFRDLDDTERQEIFNYTEYRHSKKFLRETSSREAGVKSKGA